MKNTMLKIVTAVLLLAILTNCSKKDKTKKSESISDIQRRIGVPVTVIEAVRSEIQSFETAGGTIEGIKQATLVCNVPGIIESLFVNANDVVKSGQALLRIDPDIPSSLEIAGSNYENIRKTLERTEVLYKEGGVSQEILEQVKAAYAAALTSFKAAKKAEIITAPFDGVITQVYRPLYRNADRGNPLIDIADISAIRVRLLVNETAIAKYKKGQTAILYSGADSLKGHISEVAIAGAPGNRAFAVDAEFNNRSLRMKPGAFVSIKTVVASRGSAVVLPMETVIKDGKNEFVFIIDNGKSKKINIKTGIRGGDHYEITEGLKGGELVVLSGSSALSDGIKVNIVK